MKEFFNLNEPFRFEVQDLRALTMIINVVLVITIGFASAWFGLSIAIFGIVKDFQNPRRHVNDFLIHGASVALNLYFLSLLYLG